MTNTQIVLKTVSDCYAFPKKCFFINQLQFKLINLEVNSQIDCVEQEINTQFLLNSVSNVEQLNSFFKYVTRGI